MMERIDWKKIQNIGHIVLSNPPDNRMDTHFYNDFKNLISNILTNSDVQAILLYNKGRHFSSGADLDDLLKQINKQKKYTNDKIPDFLKENVDSFYSLKKMNIPVIAAIRGVCIGAGLELALFANVRICEEGSYLSLPESMFNLIPGIGGIQNFFLHAHKAKTIEYVLSGDSLSPEEAKSMKLIDHIVPKKTSVVFAEKFALTIKDSYNPIFLKDELDKFVKFEKNKS